jgi:hypothetical protein
MANFVYVRQHLQHLLLLNKYDLQIIVDYYSNRSIRKSMFICKYSSESFSQASTLHHMSLYLFDRVLFLCHVFDLSRSFVVVKKLTREKYTMITSLVFICWHSWWCWVSTMIFNKHTRTWIGRAIDYLYSVHWQFIFLSMRRTRRKWSISFFWSICSTWMTCHCRMLYSCLFTRHIIIIKQLKYNIRTLTMNRWVIESSHSQISYNVENISWCIFLERNRSISRVDQRLRCYCY